MAWSSSVETVGKWYQANIHNYSQGSFTNCPLPLCGSVRHDCSGYISACLRHAGIIRTNQIYRSGDFLPTGAAAPQLRAAGFVCLQYNINQVQPFDIIARNGHVEIFAGKIGSSMRSWSWGSCHDGMNGHAGMPAYMAKQAYAVMWRMGGTGPGAGTPWNDLNGMFPSSAISPSNQNNNSSMNYQTYSSTIDSEVFASALANAMTPAVEKTIEADSSTGHRTRIYAALNPTIKVDELSLPLNEGKAKTDQMNSDDNELPSAS